MARTRPSTRLAGVMHERNLTQTELALRSGVSRPTINLAYHGEEISDGVWIRLAYGLNVPVAEIAPPRVAARIVAVA